MNSRLKVPLWTVDFTTRAWDTTPLYRQAEHCPGCTYPLWTVEFVTAGDCTHKRHESIQHALKVYTPVDWVVSNQWTGLLGWTVYTLDWISGLAWIAVK